VTLPASKPYKWELGLDVAVTETCNTNVWQQTKVQQIEVRTTERYIADADPQNILEPPTGGWYLSSDPIFTCYIFTTYDSARGITSMIQVVGLKKIIVILDRVKTLK